MIEEVFARHKKALVIGIGGGGDVIGCIPTANFLEFLGLEVMLGGLTWERKVVDPKPGPRRIDEILNAEVINESCALANEKTRTVYGTIFTESIVAKHLKRKVLLFDINKGAYAYHDFIDFVKKFGFDIVVGIDVGGDSLAFGNEKGIKSPLADSIMLTILKKSKNEIYSVLGVIGYGSDGELTLEELNKNIAVISKEKGYLGARGLGKKDFEIMEKLVEESATEASKLVVSAFKGKIGDFTIRGNTRKVKLTPCSMITFYFDPDVVFKHSRTANLVKETKSLKEADSILRREGYLTELYFEEELYSKTK